MCEKLDAFAEKGGVLLAVGQPAPVSCLGLASPARKRDDLLGATLSMGTEQSGFPRLADRPYVMLGKSYWEAEYASDVTRIGALLPPVPFGPPELSYPKEPPTACPALTCRAYGRGKALLADVLLNLCGLASPAVHVSPMVEITHGKGEGFEAVHFVNGSGHFGNSFFEPEVLADQTVAVPWNKATARCENLDEPGNLVYSLTDGVLTITVPKLSAHACVVVTE